jgi:hypothetical protein
MRAFVIGLVLLGLAACAPPTSPPLVSTQSPPGTGLVNAHSPLQTLNSLPPGAANLAPGPFATAPDYANITLRGF